MVESKQLRGLLANNALPRYTVSTRQFTGEILGHYQQLRLETVFQPIVDVAQHGAVIGYEALMRPFTADNTLITPQACFAMADNAIGLLQLDQLCWTLHSHNFIRQHPNGLLFLNLHPGILTHTREIAGEWYQRILQESGLAAERVVIEILEGAIDDTVLITEAVHNFRDCGFQVAIDDFGTGHSNFTRLWLLAPGIVKFDRSFIAEAVNNSMVRKVLPKLVSLIHECGSQVLIEGIETLTHASIAIEALADFLQGFYFASPAAEFSLLQEEAKCNSARLVWSVEWEI